MPSSPLGPWAEACGRVLGGCVFLLVRNPCRTTYPGEGFAVLADDGRERVCVRERDRESVCVRERDGERDCVSEREIERESV